MNVQPFIKPEDLDWTIPPGWNRTKHLLQPALDMEDGLYTLEDVLEEVKKGGLQFWPGENSAVITQVIHHPRHKQIEFWLAGGDLKELKQMAAFIEGWARQEGITHAKIIGRRGWAKALGGDWVESHTVSVKRLDT